MENLTACFEISSDSIKLLIGYELDGKPIVLYRKKKDMPGLIKDGQIADPNALIKTLAEFHNVNDEAALLKISISEICLVLPSVGLVVYDNEKTTNVVAPNNEIAKIDVANVISLVRKESIPGGNCIVDIIPDEFVLDEGRRFGNPPLGEKSKSLTVLAKIHTLPETLYSTYNRLVNQAGFRIRKAAVSVYCLAELFKTYHELPSSYLLVDMGSRLTSVSFIGDGSPYSSVSFYNGGDDLTEAIATAFDCTFSAAERLKVEYGYKEKIRRYDPCLPMGERGEGEFHQADLNNIITEYFESYRVTLTNAVNALLGKYEKKYGKRFDSIPVIFTGGASGLNGIETFMKEAFPSRECFYPVPKAIGAREAGYSTLLGLLLASSRYVGSLEDNFRGMGSVSRVAKDKGKVRRNGADSDAL